MLSGVLTSDSLTQAFRSLSQKRRHGVLDIASPTGQFLIYFYNGKIIGAQTPEHPFVNVVCDKLKGAEAISPDLCETLKSTVQELPELYRVLVGRNIVSLEHFLRAKRAYEMDILYGLRKLQGGVFKFNSKIVDVDDSLALSVAPGQLLLDMVELDAAESRLEKDLKATLTSDVCVVPLGSAGPDLSDEEAEVWRTLEITHCVREIRDRALLSEYQLTEALLGLLERRLIAPGPTGSAPNHGARALRGNPLGHMLEEQDIPDVRPRPSSVENTTLSQFNALIDEAASMLETGLDVLDFSPQQSVAGDAEVNEEQTVYCAEDDLAVNNSSVPEAKFPAIGAAKEVTLDKTGDVVTACQVESLTAAEAMSVEPGHRVSVREFWTISSVRLLDDEVLTRVTLLMTLVFLLTLGWVGPRMIDHWFQAVEVFSSVN